jgi:hypothetical protein
VLMTLAIEIERCPSPPQRRMKRPRPPMMTCLTIDIPVDSPQAALLVRVPSEENLVRSVGGKSASPVVRGLVGPSPSPMALRRLSANSPSTKTPLSLMRDASHDQTSRRYASPLGPQRPLKRSRPSLTLEIPCSARSTPSTCGESVLSLRRQNSWEQGSLADTTADEGRTVLVGEEESRAKAFVRQLVEAGVKLLAIDFDLTMISMHTGGRWWGSAETLARSVRPVWKTIVPYAMSMGLEVCVATMSQQTHLVANVLRLSMGQWIDTTKIAVRGGEKGRLVNEHGDLDTADVEGSRKQKHIKSVLQSRVARGDSALLVHQVMLIDDDALNIEEALEQGTRALLFSPDNPLFLIVGVDPASSFGEEEMKVDTPTIF